MTGTRCMNYLDLSPIRQWFFVPLTISDEQYEFKTNSVYMTNSPLIFRLSFIFILLCSSIAHAQLDSAVNCSKNKIIPDEISEATLFALQQYPELADTRIEFRFTKNNSKSFMQAQPKFKGVFKNKKNRGYLVKITPDLQLVDETIPVEALPLDVLIGWIGHELGHVLDYQQRTGMGMVGFGCRYVCSRKYKISAEERADMNAIEHGLGSYVLRTKQFIVDNADIPKTFKNHIEKYYMSPEQVIEIIDQLANSETPQDE